MYEPNNIRYVSKYLPENNGLAQINQSLQAQNVYKGYSSKVGPTPQFQPKAP